MTETVTDLITEALDVASHRNFRGLSLAYCRTVLGKEEPRVSTAKAFALRYAARLTKAAEPGMVAFWGWGSSGDCGVVVVSTGAVTVDHHGQCIMRKIDPNHLDYLGAMWWPEETS